MTGITTITLVVVSDDHYMILLAALIRSVEAHLDNGVNLDLWIVQDEVTQISMDKMRESVNSAITTIHWKKLEEIIPEGLSLPLDRSSYPLNIYMRLFIPYFIPEGVQTVLYLDADMIVLEDLSLLWNEDINNHTIAAVLDPRLKTFDNHWGGIKNYKQLGFKGDTPYFNTGLLLINIGRWRANNTTERILDVINNNKKYANYPDQYGMNIVLHDQWLQLDPRWNNFVTEPLDQPYILHYVERKPIYTTFKNGEKYKQLFYKYLNTTAWKGTQPISESRRYIKKIKNILAKFRK